MSDTQLYYDNFTGEVTRKIDEIAPPERYIRVHCGNDMFIEKWSVGDNRFIDVAYTPFDRKEGFVYSIRKAMEEKHNVRLSYMTDWTVTEEHYKKMEEAVENEDSN